MESEGIFCKYEEKFQDFYEDIVECRDSVVRIWVDESNSSLTIARDAFGKVPLYYHFVPGSFLIFSTDLNDLLDCDLVRRSVRVNLSVASSYLNDADTNTPYSSCTFFESIYTVLPGHYVKFENSGKESKRYLFFNLQRWPDLAHVNEYGDLFREKLIQSISRSVSSHTKVGAHLSGGLDSSSIVSLLCKEFSQLYVHGFFVDTPAHLKVDKEKELLIDRYFVEEVRKFTGVPVSVCYAPAAAIDIAVKYVNFVGQPLNMLNAPLAHLVAETVREKEAEVLLSGHGGDNFVGYGDRYLRELWESRNWSEFRESVFMQAREDRFLESKLSYGADKYPRLWLRYYIENQIVKYIKAGNWNLALRTLLSFSTQLGFSPVELLRRLRKRAGSWIFSSKKSSVSILSRELSFVRHSTGGETVIDGLSSDEREIYLNIFANPNIRHMEESYHRGRSHGLEVKFPYFDKDLYEVSLSVPSKLVFDNGRGRGHMRAGLRGILPEAVRNRTGKYNLGGESHLNNASSLLQSDARDFLTDSSSIWHYVDKKSFWEKAKTLSNGSINGESMKVALQVYRVVYFSIWLDRYITRK